MINSFKAEVFMVNYRVRMVSNQCSQWGINGSMLSFTLCEFEVYKVLI